jgi:hypothetical protein
MEETLTQDLWGKTGDRTKRCIGKGGRTRRGARGDRELRNTKCGREGGEEEEEEEEGEEKEEEEEEEGEEEEEEEDWLKSGNSNILLILTRCYMEFPLCWLHNKMILQNSIFII